MPIKRVRVCRPDGLRPYVCDDWDLLCLRLALSEPTSEERRELVKMLREDAKSKRYEETSHVQLAMDHGRRLIRDSSLEDLEEGSWDSDTGYLLRNEEA